MKPTQAQTKRLLPTAIPQSSHLDDSIVVLDTKGDTELFCTVRLEVEKSGHRFKWFDHRPVAISIIFPRIWKKEDLAVMKAMKNAPS
jgi:hypothetical protein